jgi:hypothetical protein
MKTNKKRPQIHTHEGAVAKVINAEQQLRRSLMACLLFEDTFYESGEDIAKRIADTVPLVRPEKVAGMAVEAREKMKLRHAPLMVVREMARHKSHSAPVRATLARVIQRADEPAEFLSMYWKNGKQPISKQVRLGLGDALNKFNEYNFAKYNRDGSVKLRDVLFMSHAKPKDAAQAVLFKKITEGTLATPDTWEVALSTGGPEADKKSLWMRLLQENKLGALALLRNLRNMAEANVNVALVREALLKLDPKRVLPYRFIAAANYAPNFEPELEQAMFKSVAEKGRLKGLTTLVIDVSGSMDAKLSARSEMSRIDAAAGLAMIIRELADEVIVLTFSNSVKTVAPRRGFALRDAIIQSQPHGGTELGKAVKHALKIPSNRLIVITDEQAHGGYNWTTDSNYDVTPDPVGRDAYMVNVGTYKNGIGYGAWTHIDGFSEAIVDYIYAVENAD